MNAPYARHENSNTGFYDRTRGEGNGLSMARDRVRGMKPRICPFLPVECVSRVANVWRAPLVSNRSAVGRPSLHRSPFTFLLVTPLISV